MKFSGLVLSLSIQLLSCKTTKASSRFIARTTTFISPHQTSYSTKRFSTDQKANDASSSKTDHPYDDTKSPWAPENNTLTKKKGINKSRFRQHVNPLARKFQMETEINDEWPNDGTFTDTSLPLHIDIGCGKGGFLLELAAKRASNPDPSEGERNYLGLEIRPSVALYAKGRVEKRGLAGKVDFIGCNANVDLDRVLKKYAPYGEIGLVSIQYPDPHFKKSHQKRRVVTKELVDTLAKYLKEGREIFIQSDIKDVLDNMRETIREFGSEYFVDSIEALDEYMEVNPVGVPTEREISVLDQDLPVYRTVFRRNSEEWKE